MRVANPEFLTKFVDELEGQPEHAEIAAAVEAWLNAVREIDVRTWGALAEAFDDRLSATIAFSLGRKHRLMAEFDLADSFVLVKWVGRRA